MIDSELLPIVDLHHRLFLYCIYSIERKEFDCNHKIRKF